MDNMQLLIKNLSDYFNLDMSEFDKKRVVEYVEGYVGSLPSGKPEVITKVKTVFKYISDKEIPSKDLEPKDIVLINPFHIISLVTQKTGISLKKLKSPQRYSETVLARHVAMYFINIKAHQTLKRTGEIFNRDHTSVINAIRNVRSMIEGENPKYSELFKYVLDSISHPIK